MFWLTFKESTRQKNLKITSGSDIDEPQKIWKINLAWSEYHNGKWSSKKITKDPVEVAYSLSNINCVDSSRCFTCQNGQDYATCSKKKWARSPKSLYLREIVNDQNLNVFIYWQDDDEKWEPFYRNFIFTGHTNQPELGNEYWEPVKPPLNLCTQEFESLAGEGNLSYCQSIYGMPGALVTPILTNINTRQGYQPQRFSFRPLYFSPFATRYAFLADNKRTFFIKYYDYGKTYLFQTFYHPYSTLFLRELNYGGIESLLKRDIQTDPSGYTNNPEFNFLSYDPTNHVSTANLPKEDVDFKEGAYSIYNWELFFHIPLLIAVKLSQNQRFGEAMKWFHYIFNPTDTSSEGNETRSHYWQTKPFFERTKDGYAQEQIKAILTALAKGDEQDQAAETDISAVQQWCQNPFKPDVVARLRSTAYQKAVVMKYLDNLLNWGDQLFRQDTIETINEATQLYVLAAEILGRRPEILKPRFRANVQTYNSLTGLHPIDFSNPLVEAEQIVPFSDINFPAAAATSLSSVATLYFSIPKNNILWGYWDTVADRLFKIRNGLNIEGVARSLALFEPPIDPALLVRAAAAGLDLGSILSDLNSPLPHYRFNIILQKALELCAEVKALGAELLAVLEKRDAEALALLKFNNEINLLNLVKTIKKKQVEEAQDTLEGLNRYIDAVQARIDYYSARTLLNELEKQHLDQMGISLLI